MTRLVSTRTKIEQLGGLAGTRELNAAETEFVTKLWDMQRAAGGGLVDLSEKQTDWLDDLWARHFA
ncbi:MAG: hypothetical protein JNM76_14810 [Betaproteobacteria bacterium]|nr:hypothetical protein [Betaproteobacteria bacterium]